MKYFTKVGPSIALIVLLSIVLFLFVTQSSALDSPVEPDTGFELEGNAVWDGVGDYDWENAPEEAVRFLDPHSKAETDPTTFKPDGKFDKPEAWSILPGNVGPSQNELTNTAVWAIRPGELDGDKPDDFWLIMAMERTKKEGTFFLDFEYNQRVWDGSSGGLTRTRGDVVVGFELKGNPIDRMKDLNVLIVQYFPGEQPDLCQTTYRSGNQLERVELGSDPCPAYGDSGFYYRYLADGAILSEESTLGQATMNENPIAAPWPSFDAKGGSRDVIGPFEFAEAAINLTALGIEPTCSTFSSAHAKTRSSLEPNADLKDLVQPMPISTNCRLDGHKFLDLNGDGEWTKPDEPPLKDWTIELTDGTSTASTTTDAEGYYQFEYLADGTYTVSEVCPPEWVQTMPGMTGFDDCGKVTYTRDVDIHNREYNNLDFGNGSPAIEVEKSCTADVFLGDDVEVTITVSNTGNVDLYDVSVVDDMIDLDEMIDRLAPGQSRTFKDSYVAETATGGRGGGFGEGDEPRILLPLIMRGSFNNDLMAQDPITNVAYVVGQYAAVEVSDSDSCITEVHELTVSKNAQTSITRQYLWALDKEAGEDDLLLLFPGQPAKVDYTITVDLAEPSVKEEWAVWGEITIDNPAPIDAELSAVTDIVAPNFAATVVCPSPLEVPAEGSLTCTYGPVALPNGNPRLNTATAVLINNNGNQTEFEGSIPFDFDDAEVQSLDESVDVFDDNLITASNETGFIGTVTLAEAPKTFKYTYQIGPFVGDECQAGIHDNTASLKTRDSASEIKVTVSVPYECIKTITIAFEDLPTTSTDWDYNDIVLDVSPILSYSDDGDLRKASFAIEQGGEFAVFTHTFSFEPTAFACGGTYTRKIAGVTVDDQVDYENGDNIVIVEDSGWTPKPVELTIDFDEPAKPGDCPLDLSQPEFDLVGKFHGEGLFFAPWILVYDSFDDIVYPVQSGDVRLLNIPQDWTWPPERTPIWQCYPDGVTAPPEDNPSVGPSFSALWWQADSQCS